MKERYLIGLFLSLLLLCSTACIDTVPDEVLAYSDFYTGVNDADNAILGLYGQFMELAGQTVVLNELRADLLDVTNHATIDLQEINLNAPSPNNPWTNVSRFYGVIQTCNDLLYNLDIMLKENKIIQAEYGERYADVAALRTWIYFQLGIHFGQIPYITQPVVTIDNLNRYKNSELSLNDLLPELIRCMESLPTLENYQSSPLVQQSLDGYSLAPYFIDKRCLLGDLYLFNNDYEKAAVIYRQVLAVDEDLSADVREQYRKNRLYCYPWTSGGTPDWFEILYTDGKNHDSGSLYNAWRNMFAATTTGRTALEEMIWFIAYDSKFAPAYPFLELFNPVGNNGGKYYLKPSDYAVDSVWGGEIQKNGYPFDARGLTGAYRETGGEHYVMKYSCFEETPSGDVRGNWFLYRAALLHLRYAEAANRAGYPKLAWAIVNDGLGTGGSAFLYKKENGDNYPDDSIRITGNSPFDLYPEPYFFDGRQCDQPWIRSPWRSNGGVRGRANLPNVPFPEDAITQQDSIRFVEKLIIREAALELGFEGNRWQDLLRIARRLNRETPGEGTRFLWDDNIRKKYERSGISGTNLSSEEKWFLPLYR
ncbi:MAG: RagB/SusD family nutrient uptake outer membrane protein [Tannerella sp.]|jgi:hypothetical protein|nr:RagB/SusD family nutrient uptake outer membrane protein [Tannerella sp.]